MNTIWKFIPVSFYDTTRLEQWLERMAAEGMMFLHPFQFGLLGYQTFHWGKFSREEPKPQRRYRLCPAPEMYSYPTPEQMELYEASGWNFVTTFTTQCFTYFLFSSDDPEAQEPYTDPDSLRLALRSPLRDARLWIVLALLNVLSGVWRRFQLASNPLVYDLSLTDLILIPLWVAVTLDLLVSWYVTWRFRRQLKGGEVKKPKLPRVLALPQYLLSLFPFLAAGLLVFTLAFTTLRSESGIPLPEWDPDFPLVTLDLMEGDGSWTPHEDFTITMNRPIHIRYNAVDIDYSLPFSRTLVRYHVNQGGSGTSGDSSLDLYYYLARSGHGAEDQLDALQEYATSGKNLTALPTGLPFQRADIPGAEEFLYRREDTQWEVLARREDRVLSLTYDGNLDLEDWFGDIATMLTPTGP